MQLKRHGVTQPGRLFNFVLVVCAHVFVGYVQTIVGEGMPIFERDEAYGDLYVEYNVLLPTELSAETKRRTFSLLLAGTSSDSVACRSLCRFPSECRACEG